MHALALLPPCDIDHWLVPPLWQLRQRASRLQVVREGCVAIAEYSTAVSRANNSIADPVDLSHVKDVHEVAEAFKQYLREAPEPLVTNLPLFEQAFGALLHIHTHNSQHFRRSLTFRCSPNGGAGKGGRL